MAHGLFHQGGSRGRDKSYPRRSLLYFVETFEEHREALLHVLKNIAITALVVEENYLRRIVETYFGLRDNSTSMVDSMDVSEANFANQVLKCLFNANQMQTALLRAITNEKGLINKFFKIYSFKYSFH